MNASETNEIGVNEISAHQFKAGDLVRFTLSFDVKNHTFWWTYKKLNVAILDLPLNPIFMVLHVYDFSRSPCVKSFKKNIANKVYLNLMPMDRVIQELDLNWKAVGSKRVKVL